MQFVVPKENFLGALNTIIKATTVRGIQPILGNILIDTIDATSLKLTATDLDITLEAIIPASITEEGKITLQAKKLFDIITNVSDASINFDIDTEKLMAKITSGKAKFELMGISANEFPAINRIEKENEVEIDLKLLLKSIKQTLFSSASFETSNILSGIFFSIQQDNLEMAATDGNRLARKQANLSKSIDKEITAIIPTRILQELIRITGFCEEKVIRVGFADGQISFRLSDKYLLSRLLEGKYPDYPKLIPLNYEVVVLANREDLLGSVKRTSVMANERTNIIKLDFEKNKLNLSANTPDMGDASDSMEVDYKGDGLKIAFNYKFLIDSLHAIDTNDVRIELGSSLSPVLFKPDTEDGYLCLVMPVQVK